MSGDYVCLLNGKQYPITVSDTNITLPSTDISWFFDTSDNEMLICNTNVINVRSRITSSPFINGINFYRNTGTLPTDYSYLYMSTDTGTIYSMYHSTAPATTYKYHNTVIITEGDASASGYTENEDNFKGFVGKPPNNIIPDFDARKLTGWNAKRFNNSNFPGFSYTNSDHTITAYPAVRSNYLLNFSPESTQKISITISSIENDTTAKTVTVTYTATNVENFNSQRFFFRFIFWVSNGSTYDSYEFEDNHILSTTPNSTLTMTYAEILSKTTSQLDLENVPSSPAMYGAIVDVKNFIFKMPAATVTDESTGKNLGSILNNRIISEFITRTVGFSLQDIATAQLTSINQDNDQEIAVILYKPGENNGVMNVQWQSVGTDYCPPRDGPSCNFNIAELPNPVRATPLAWASDGVVLGKLNPGLSITSPTASPVFGLANQIDMWKAFGSEIGIAGSDFGVFEPIIFSPLISITNS